MLILLEGCDGTGKSTLADAVEARIAELYPDDEVIRLHSGPLERDPIEEYVFSIQDYKPGTGTHIIADRWHFGETVYGPLYRGKSAISEEQWRWIELWLDSRGGATWIVTNSLEEVTRRLASRGEDFLRPEHVEHVLSSYEHDFKEKSVTYAWKVELNNPEDAACEASEIVSLSASMETIAKEYLNSSTTYVGALRPDVLLVGDKRGGKHPFKTDGAFYPVNGNSATYLLRSFRGVSWQDIGFINANEEPDLEAAVSAFFSDTRYTPSVVALGAEATKTLCKQVPDLSFGRVPHPQYVRRFHNSRNNEYGALIRKTAYSLEDNSKWPN